MSTTRVASVGVVEHADALLGRTRNAATTATPPVCGRRVAGRTTSATVLSAIGTTHRCRLGWWAMRAAGSYNDPLNGTDPMGLWGIHVGPINIGSDGCTFGTNPNGSCRGSNAANDLHAVATGLEVAAAVVVVAVAPEVAPVMASYLVGGAVVLHGASAAVEASEDGGCKERCWTNLAEGGLDLATAGLASQLPARQAWLVPGLFESAQLAAAAAEDDSCPEEGR